MIKLSGLLPILFVLGLLFSGVSIALSAGESISRHTVVVIGDSLSSAYGMPMARGWVQLLAQRLVAEQPKWKVINTSITGDTTHGGLNRLAGIIERQQPNILIIELGGNDGLRGFDLETTRRNLQQMIALAREHSIKVLLLGVRLPPNYGEAYSTLFENIYRQLALDEQVPVVQYFLEGIAEHLDLMQADGIHPGEAAQQRMLDNVWPALLPLLEMKKLPNYEEQLTDKRPAQSGG